MAFFCYEYVGLQPDEWSALASWVQAIGTLIGLAIAFLLGGAEHRHQKVIQKERTKEKLNQLKAMAFTCENALNSVVALIKMRLEGAKVDSSFIIQKNDLKGRLSVIRKRMSEYPMSDMDAQEINYFINLEHGLDFVCSYFNDDSGLSSLNAEVVQKRVGLMLERIKPIHLDAQCLLDSIDKRIAQV
tara:strand:- start:1293 stop:1853 length:561 start_codon:yes stop_codon:yes gene_type:complete